MKPVTEQMLEEHHRATMRGMTEGAVVSGIISGAGSWYLNKRWATYRTLPSSLKALGIVCIVLPVLTLQGERRGTEYDQSTWENEKGYTLATENEADLEAKWLQMSTKEKIGDWADRHEYSIILGSWAGSLALTGAVISRNQYQTFAQKIVQARMWAQGLTVGILIVAGALQGAKRREAAQNKHIDHSWQEILSEQEHRENKIKLAPVAL